MPIQRLSNAGQSGYRYKSLIAGITPVASVPTIGAATALTYSTASVAFTAPGAYAATTYTATSSPGGLTGTSATSPITVSGLSEQTAYTFTVTATNASGTSSPSAASSSITTPVAFTPDSGYDALATVTLSSATSTITFAGIPSGYKHLQIRTLIRTNRADANDSAYITINGDTSANYATHRLSGTGAAAGSFGYTAQVPSSGTSWIALATGGNATSNVFAASIIDILDYANTNKYKTLRSLSGNEDNSGTDNSRFWFMSNLWLNTSAITSITLTATGSFVTNSTFALYGVK